MTVVGIIQARMTSSRLPGKVLADIAGKPCLEQMITRVRQSRRLDKIIVATTALPSDDPIASLCKRLDIGCYRGDEADVLGRYLEAAHWAGADVVVRLTADCPMHDASVIDGAIALFDSGNYDYVSNAVVRTYPDGLDVEVFGVSVLEEAAREATDTFLREHVTTYIRGSRSDLPRGNFRLGHFVYPIDYGKIRWTLDRPDDLEKIRRFFSLLPDGFGWKQALELELRLASAENGRGADLTS